eukprot:6257278-Pyramimonas_sp.AAC.1
MHSAHPGSLLLGELTSLECLGASSVFTNESPRPARACLLDCFHGSPYERLSGVLVPWLGVWAGLDPL